MFPALRRLRRYPELDGKTLLICVGAMRCATSWLHTYLGTLDGVTVSPLKELHFFSARFAAHALGNTDQLATKRLAYHLAQPGDAPTNLRQRPTFRASVDAVQMLYDDNAYFGHFARIADERTRVICDITPAYATLGPDGFEYLREFCASQDISVRLLFVMRDPIARMWSQLRHMTGAGSGTDYLEKWAEAFASPAICARADYQGTVSDLDATFPADDILYLFYEDLFTETATRAICAHLDVAFHPAETGRRLNETTVKAEMPDEARAAARRLLTPQYAFCRERFGDRIPSAWVG